MLQHPSLRFVDHRPWPLPREPWAFAMTWLDLAFLHWPVAPETLRGTIPAGLELDRFEGDAWIGVVPFRMEGVRPRFVPSIPGLSSITELNVRTYVVAEGKPGIWFYSLDADSRLAVRGARLTFHLPYFNARMSMQGENGAIRYFSERVHRGAPPARFLGSYRPTAPADRTELSSWLTERYCLYSASPKGRIFRGDIHHPPWPLENGEAELEALDMTRLVGIELPARAPLVHFAARLDVVGWRPREVVRVG